MARYYMRHGIGYNMPRNQKDKYDNNGSSRRMHSYMSPEDLAAGKKSLWTEMEITGTIRNLSPNLFKLTNLTALYLKNNLLLRLPSDISTLTNLRSLDITNNKLRTLPAEIGDLINLRELLLSHNNLRMLPYEMGKLFNLMVLGLQGNPLNKDIMSIYTEPNGTSKLLTFMLDNLQVTTPAPPQRPWIPLTRPTRDHPTCLFTVMCYNVLCDKYATRQMYSYCPSWALSWDYRKKGIMDEIRHYAADIINLQEVEMDQFYNYFLPELKNEGYAGIYSPKSRAKTMAENERKYVDGCAIFYRVSKFTLIKEHLVEFNQLAMANADGLEHMLNRVMPKDNIGLAALLQTTEAAWENVPDNMTMPAQPVLVCTAHIHWDPEFCDVKLIQTMMLSSELRSILEESAHTLRVANENMNLDASSIQLVLSGDFNSLPESGVIEFLNRGQVSQDHKDFKDFSYKSCLEKISGCDKPNEFTHSFKLASAYSADIMPYTNYTFDFKGIIDYIFYSKQTMTPLGLLGPHNADWLRDSKIAGCPHPHIYSDHFPLLVELEMESTVGPPQQQQINGIISHSNRLRR
ncbi:PREDICTED: CCR4-NOT transcription complex subunit 6-like isoform X2 [Nicrophorus vespilloides]|uniref:poly(A)-specific ribonuclease n=1 Tax=Nicrophorus vespilloides TaxID=110193 RepID=A0ABM1N6I7_NICVS|nr:PREDICTED: CCR4-NOT transcription complex subunit 6-like isoform X2 [Nicrophorus vespilloides]